MTGILSTGALKEAEMTYDSNSGHPERLPGLPMKGRKYGTVLNPDGLYAPIHQVCIYPSFILFSKFICIDKNETQIYV